MTNEEAGNSTNENTVDSSDFFSQLESEVNGMQTEGEVNTNTEVTQDYSGSENSNPQIESNGSESVDWDSENNPYKKRYKDSSREAIKMNDRLRELTPFVPVLDAMKQDSGLVDHVRNYLQNGGAPSGEVANQLSLPEDFQYDAHEAVTDPNSDSAKVLATQVDNIVQQRVGSILQGEKQRAAAQQQKFMVKKQEQEFKEKHKMSDADFEEFKKTAQSRRLTLEDVFYIVNKDKTNQNVANSTKKDMLNQMKNVRNMPTSASDSNSQGSGNKSMEDNIFDAIAGVDTSVDNLFG